MITRRSLMASVAAVGATIALPKLALAQAGYPQKPITLVIPFAAGGIGDVIGRAIADKVSATLGQQVVVDNRAGAGSIVGSQHVVASAADGYTMLQVTGANVGAVLLQSNVNFNYQDDFEHIIGIGSFPSILLTPISSKILTFEDIKTVATEMDGIPFASGGIGSYAHLGVASMLNSIGVEGIHIPFKGNSVAIQSILGEQVELFFPTTVDALELVVTGRVRALAVAADARLEALPDVPTMAELGYPHVDPRIWYGYVMPKGTPPEIITMMHDAIAEAMAHPDVIALVEKAAFDPKLIDGPALKDFMKLEGERWGKVITDNKISLG